MNANIIFLVFLFGIIAWSLLFLFREKRRQQVSKFKMSVNDWLKYLQSDAIKQGDFSMFKEVSIEFIENQKDLIVTNFGYLMQENPEKIINLINLDIDQAKKNYLNQLMADELIVSINKTINAAFKVWGYDKENNTDIKIISYIASLLESDIRTIFALELKSKIRATGGYLHISLTNDLEEIVGVRV